MAEKRLKKNISFSPNEKDIYDFLGEVPNASALIKKLVLNHMIKIGYYKSLEERAVKICKEDIKNSNSKKEYEKEIAELIEKIFHIINTNKS